MNETAVKDHCTIQLHGRVALFGPDGTECPLPRRKERALIALLALSPDRRRTRAWIMDKLWSGSPPDKAAASLRRALSNLRGPLGGDLLSDRHDVWLNDGVACDTRHEADESGTWLGGIDDLDPELDDWLRAKRAGLIAPSLQAPSPPPISLANERTPSAETVVVLSLVDESVTQEEKFLLHFLLDCLSNRLTTMGDVTVLMGEPDDPERLETAASLFWIDVLSNATQSDWHVRLRIKADPSQRFLWSGSATFPLDLRAVCEGTDVAAFVSTTIAALLGRAHVPSRVHQSDYISLQRASGQLFTGNLEDLQEAEAELTRLTDTDGAVPALAWRAFACLTRALEFREDADTLLPRARELLKDALDRDPTNALALSIAAGIELKLGDDPDLGAHFARNARKADDRDPYALDAAAQAAKHEGDAQQAADLALLGQAVSQGLPNAFYWNMEVCLTTLAAGHLDTSFRAAQDAHLKNPTYRPALRYTCALGLLTGQPERANRAAQRLAGLEPGFTIDHLRADDYPVHTLRATGRLSDLEPF